MPGSQVPQADGDITAAGQGAPIGAKRHRPDPAGVADQDHVSGQGRDRHGNPDPGRPACASRDDRLLASGRGGCGTLIDPAQSLGVGDLFRRSQVAGRLLTGVAAVFGHRMLASWRFPTLRRVLAVAG